MEMEAGAALVGERPSHERRDQALHRRDLLHRRLEHEGPVGGVERRGVLHVDLVLRVHELVVPGVRLQPELVRPEQHLQVDLARVGDRAHGVDARELVDVAPDPAGRGRIALAQEPLELRPDDREETVGRVAVDHAREERPRARRPVVRAVEPPRLAEAPRDLGLPGDDPQRVEVGADREVDVAFLRRRRRACAAGPCPSRPRRTRLPPLAARRSGRSGCPCRARCRAGRCRGAAPP